jgi:hypothetical protein
MKESWRECFVTGKFWGMKWNFIAYGDTTRALSKTASSSSSQTMNASSDTTRALSKTASSSSQTTNVDTTT